MKTMNKLVILLFALFLTLEGNASNRVVFWGTVKENGSVYRAKEVQIQFKDLQTGKETSTSSNYWGQYSILLYKGKYAVTATLQGSKVIFRGVFDVPNSDGIINLSKFYTFSGKLHDTKDNSDFHGYKVQIEGVGAENQGVFTEVELKRFGDFSVSLQQGKYEVMVFDAKGRLHIGREIDIQSDKSADFVVLTDQATVAGETAEEDRDIPIATSDNATQQSASNEAFLVASIAGGGWLNTLIVFVAGGILFVLLNKSLETLKKLVA